jgi:hypothetical protein
VLPSWVAVLFVKKNCFGLRMTMIQNVDNLENLTLNKTKKTILALVLNAIELKTTFSFKRIDSPLLLISSTPQNTSATKKFRTSTIGTNTRLDTGDTTSRDDVCSCYEVLGEMTIVK